MTIKDKINKFLIEKKLSHADVGRRYNTSQQNVSRFLGPKGKVPLDFVVWLKTEYPEIDLERLMLNKTSKTIVRESNVSYEKARNAKETILEEIGEILDRHL